MTAQAAASAMDRASLRVQEAEERLDLLKYTIDGWCSWALLRFQVVRQLEQRPADSAAADPSRLSVAQRLGRLLRNLLSFRRLHRARIVVKTYSSARAELVDGRRKDVFFDDVLQQTGNGFKLESDNSPQALAEPSLVPADLPTIGLTTVAERLAQWFPHPEADAQAEVFSRVVRDEFGIEWPRPVIALSLSYFRWARRLYSLVLRVVRPACVLVADGGEFAVVAAAKALRIPVAECQHGFLSRYYTPYSWSAYARPYKWRMPIPDRFFSQGTVWSEEMAATGFWDAEIRTVGNLRLDEYRRRIARVSGDQCHVLLTTQGVDTERLIQFIQETVAQLDDGVRYHLWIKLHPIFDRSSDRWNDAFGGNPSIQILSPDSTQSTLALMTKADLHVSIFSYCHYEALGLRIPTVILPLYGCEIVQELANNGAATLVRDPSHLAQVITRWRTLQVSRGVADRYYAPDALHNMLREIEALQSVSVA